MKRALKSGLKQLGLLELASELQTRTPWRLGAALGARRRYSDYLAEARRAYGAPREIDRALAEEGSVAVPQALAVTPAMREQIGRAYEGGELVSYSFGLYSAGLKPDAECVYMNRAPIARSGLVEAFLASPALGRLERHVGAHMRLVNVCVFKIFPEKFGASGSFLWHRDLQTSDSYKLIAYLTDVGKDDGPFQYLPGSQRGYRGLVQFGASRLRHAPAGIGRTYLGTAGDGVLFDINGYHVGGRTTGAARIVVVYHLKPSLVPCAEHYRRHGFGSVGDAEFGPDPHRVWWN